MNILIVTDYLPYPSISGDTIRVYNLIQRISRVHEITLLVLFDSPEFKDSISHLMEFCRQVTVVDHHWPDPLTCLPDMFQYLMEGKPMELRLLYSQQMGELIDRLTSEQDFDIVQIEHSRLALYRDNISPKSNCASILTFHNVAYDQSDRISHIEKNQMDRFRSWIFSHQIKSWEPAYAGNFDRCITVSDVDRKNLLGQNPDLAIEVVPNGTDTKKFQPLEGGQTVPTLLFIGSMSYAPCVDGAVYFCHEILPYIRELIHDIQVWIVGASPSAQVTQLANESVHVTGYVEDIVPFYKKSMVSIVPIRAGGGTRLKILEAMAFGRPVVSTTIGCEGLDVINGEHLLVADDPRKFAEQTIRLLKDKSLYCRIAENARDLVVNKYDWDVIADDLLKVYQEIAG
jgi:glycosyltransferase involved in cell wall biosynthesis